MAGGLRIGFPLAGKRGPRNAESARPSGSTLSTLTLARWLKDVDITPVMLLHNDGPTAAYIKTLGLDAHIVGVPYFDKRTKITKALRKELIAAWKEKREEIKSLKLDAIHTNDAHMHRTWGFFCEDLSVPQFWHERGLFKHPSISQGHLQNAAALIAISDFVKNLAPDERRESVQVVPNPIDLSMPVNKEADRAWLRELVGAPAESTLFVMVANSNTRKRWDLYFAAAAQAAMQRTDFRFLAVGLSDPAEAGAFVQAMPEAVRGQMHDLGYRSDAVRVISGADVMVATARDEPLGRTIVEALLAETPILAASGGGHEEILSEAASHCLVSPDSVEEFTARFLAAETLVRQHKSLAPALAGWASIRFSPERHVRRIASIYRQALAGRR